MTLVDATTGEILADLESLETVIERGLSSFVEVGTALMQIREERLYRASHDTFENYCRERWGFGRDRGEQLIRAAEVVTLMPTIVGIPAIANEAQARALGPVRNEPEKMVQALTSAAEAAGGTPTAADIAEAVADLVTSTEQKRQDRAELDELMDELQPEGFDPEANKAAVEARGAFARLCRDIPKLGTPAAFVSCQRADLRERHIGYAEAAHAWLDEFLLTIREEA